MLRPVLRPTPSAICNMPNETTCDVFCTEDRGMDSAHLVVVERLGLACSRPLPAIAPVRPAY